MLYLGADYRGYKTKEAIKRYLTKSKVKFQDLGTHNQAPSDYVDYALEVGRLVGKSPDDHRGILICGSGVGMVIAANKVKGVRAGLTWDTHVVRHAVENDDINILCLPSEWLNQRQAVDIIKHWLAAKFDGAARHIRRLQKLKKHESRVFK